MEFYDLEIKLRSYLNKHKIRLCDSPYTIENEPGDDLKKLAERLSKEFTCEVSEVEKVLNNLRLKAISNMKCIDKFKKENVCTIKIHQPKSSQDITLEIHDFQQSTGLNLKQEISKLLFVSDNLKIIFKGKLINDNEKLIDQGLNNNCKVMILNITENDVARENESKDFGKTKDMAQYLANRAIDGKFVSEFMNVEITNQSGQVLSLTNEEKSFLTFGLAMHQQAITSIANGQFHLALLYCLEADEALTKSQYSESIDNTAILQLDIVWCYYCLQSIDEIPTAKIRLDKCEERMKKCYGEGNERINKIRKKTSFEGIPESINVYRLYMLKAIIAYYENDVGNCREFLLKAQDIYNAFVITEPLITQVMVLGFTREQSIEGLRVSKDINSCVDYIWKREEDKRNLEIERQADLKRNAVAKYLGKTRNGSRIDVKALERLIDQSHMNQRLCLAAIRRANNNFEESMELLFSREEQLLSDITLQQQEGLVVDGNISYEEVKKEKEAIHQLQQLVNADKAVIKRYLRQAGGNVEMALDLLMDENANLHSSSSNSTSSDQENSENKEIEKQLYKTIGEGASQTLESRYINPDLTNEILAFNKFARLLNIQEIVNDDNVTW